MLSGIPSSLLLDLDAVPRDRPVALLMRHAARFPIIDLALTFEVGLTEAGVRDAEALGGWLKDRFLPGRLMATPVGRCLDTAAAIARGAGWNETVQADERLSHPFMEPAWDLVAAGQVNGRLPDPLRTLLELLLESPERGPVLDVMVSHDTVVGTVAGGLLHAPVSADHWPAFMEGVFIWQAEDQVYARWRGVETRFTRQLKRISAPPTLHNR